MAIIIEQDAFFSKLFQTGMTDPNSKVYLPQILLGTSSPSLNPYTMETLDLGDYILGGVSIDILLTNIIISGIPNVSVLPQDGGSFTLSGLNASINAQFCKLLPPPAGVADILSLSSNFKLSFTDNQLTGKLTLLISQAGLTANMVISGDQLINITTTIVSLHASVPGSATITPSITFDAGGGDFWANVFTRYIKKPSTIETIVEKINNELNSASVISSLSSELTTIFRNAIKQQLNP